MSGPRRARTVDPRIKSHKSTSQWSAFLRINPQVLQGRPGQVYTFCIHQGITGIELGGLLQHNKVLEVDRMFMGTRRTNGQGYTYKNRTSYRTVLKSHGLVVTASGKTIQESRRNAKLGWEVIEVRGPMDGGITRDWETSILDYLRKHGAALGVESIQGRHHFRWRTLLSQVDILSQLSCGQLSFKQLSSGQLSLRTSSPSCRKTCKESQKE